MLVTLIEKVTGGGRSDKEGVFKGTGWKKVSFVRWWCGKMVLRKATEKRRPVVKQEFDGV